MATYDARGNPAGSESIAAREAAERALWRMMSFYDTPLADLDAAIAADPGWALPHVMKAGFLLSLTEPSLCDEAASFLRAPGARAVAPARERAHSDAVQPVLEGRWHAACRSWDELLVEYPRDALALQWAQLWDSPRRRESLRLRPARALPEWDDAIRCTPTCSASMPSAWRRATCTRRPRTSAGARWRRRRVRRGRCTRWRT